MCFTGIIKAIDGLQIPMNKLENRIQNQMAQFITQLICVISNTDFCGHNTTHVTGHCFKTQDDKHQTRHVKKIFFFFSNKCRYTRKHYHHHSQLQPLLTPVTLESIRHRYNRNRKISEPLVL